MKNGVISVQELAQQARGQVEGVNLEELPRQDGDYAGGENEDETTGDCRGKWRPRSVDGENLQWVKRLEIVRDRDIGD
ncbi:unnamed protein product [Linum trigynum]|uniref:Uncharacterized protein n=1 Tax=Linum trigynum TaxID=586398 RepID=A0AAV2EE25_9ROSI